MISKMDVINTKTVRLSSLDFSGFCCEREFRGIFVVSGYQTVGGLATVADNRGKTESTSKPAVKMATNRSSSELFQRIFWFSIPAFGK